MAGIEWEEALSVARFWNSARAFYSALPKVMSCLLMKDENRMPPPTLIENENRIIKGC